MFRCFLFSLCLVATCQVYGSKQSDSEDRFIRQDVFGTDFLQEKLHPPFRCPDMSPSPTVPTSVEFVKAADVKVIAALGDSLTTAIGANGSDISSIPFEFRDVSWSIGGKGTYQNVITLANIFKVFNPKLLGPAPKITLSGYPTTVNDTGFNFAVTGHNTLNVTDQIRHMIDTFKSYPGLNYKEDWKVVTMLIGMNDICDYCKDNILFSPDSFVHYMTKALDMMMNEMPRTIVNVVQILPMKPLREVNKPTLGCQLQKSFCSCLVLPEENSTELQTLEEMNYEFQRRLEKLLQGDRYFKQDFAAVLQPYLTLAQPPRLPSGTIDMSFFTADCFHFTVKGHEELAKGLWNNMVMFEKYWRRLTQFMAEYSDDMDVLTLSEDILDFAMFQPAGKKEMIQTFSEPVDLICPSEEHPYIYTRPVPSGSSVQELNHFCVTVSLLSVLALFNPL